MKKTKDEAKASVQEPSRTPRKRRRRKKNYADDMYGARPAPEDAHIIDEYARLKEMDRAEVVRLALHQFALRQQMRYQPKDAFQEMQEKVFREYFAALFERLDALSGTLQNSPQAIAGHHGRQAFRTTHLATENGETHSGNDTGGDQQTPRIESVLRDQKRALEQVLLASTLALRLLANYLVEPQLRRLEPSDPASLEPHLRAAEAGKSAWSAATAEVMRRTGKQVMDELNFTPPETESGTPDAPQNGVHRAAPTLADADISAAL